MKPPAFQFYADDFLAGTADMTQPEVGAYILLLCHQWGRGEIPADPARAALIAKGEVPAHVMAKFPNGRNPRLERVRETQEQWREKSSRAGKKSADLRNQTSTNAQPNLNQQGNQTSTKPQPTPQPKPNSPVSSLQSPVSIANTIIAPAGAVAGAEQDDCPFPPESGKKPRERNQTLDALAACGGADPLQVTPRAWSGIAAALADIKAVCADVNPQEIARRAGNYRTHMREAMLSPHALAKNWALCDKPAENQQPVKGRAMFA